MTKIFLTGGTGYIGKELTKALLARGWTVTALVRRPDSPQARALAEIGADCTSGDVLDRESMRAGMSGADIVIHNAGVYEVSLTAKEKLRMHAVNVAGAENVLSLALELGIPRTLHISSSACLGDTGSEVRDESYRHRSPPRTYYEQTKNEAHDLALDYQARGLPLIIVCPTHVVGGNDHSPYGYFIRMYVNRILPPFAWAPDVIHSPVHIHEAVEGIALAAEKGRPGETYLLAGDPVKLRDMFDIWAAQPGGFRIRFFLPFWLAAAMFAPMEPLLRGLGLPAFISRESVWSNKGSIAVSNEKARRELGWTHPPASEMWAKVFEEEQLLLARRTKRDLLSRLKPF